MIKDILDKALLFDGKFRLMGFFKDKKSIAGDLMLYYPEADFCYMPHDPTKSYYVRSDVLPFSDVQSLFALDNPTELLKIINKFQDDERLDPHTVKYLEVQNDEFVIRYKLRTVLAFLKSLDKLFTAIESKDYNKLEELLWYQNKNLRKVFELETGVKLGTSDKSMRQALKKWLASAA